MSQSVTNLSCDYLVIGAGAASLAFIDTLLTELPSTKVVLVDKNAAPGGHWVHDYDFVTLHQPSLLYGVASKQLEGNWMTNCILKGTLPWKHQATKKEILAYFQKFVDEKVASGQLQYFPECEYDFGAVQHNDTTTHAFASLGGNAKYTVQVKYKLVNGILGECKIPAQCPPQFAVDDGITLLTPNQLYDSYQQGSANKENTPIKKKYIVLGCGKTAMDTVVYLLRTMKVKPDDISWIIPADVWMLAREGPNGGGPWSYPRALLEAEGDREKACADLEAKGIFERLDKDITPTRFRFPVIGKDELKYMRKIKQIVRRGRVTSINLNDGTIKIGFGKDQEPWFLPPSDDIRAFVHCTSPGPFNGTEIDELFVSDTEMRLSLLFAPPVSISMSVLAKLESARRQGKLDLDFGNKLLRTGSVLNGDVPSENDVLRHLVRSFKLEGDVPSLMVSLSTLAVFFSLVDKDPMVGYEWMKANRLSFFSIPGFKSGILNDLSRLSAGGETLGFREDEIEMFTILHEKLLPLKDK